MRKTFGIIAASAFAIAAISAPVAAAPSDAACFGQIHKAVNAGALEVDNVGQFVKSLEAKGQSKKTIVTSEPYCVS
jgi:hypothetical protein